MFMTMIARAPPMIRISAVVIIILLGQWLFTWSVASNYVRSILQVGSTSSCAGSTLVSMAASAQSSTPPDDFEYAPCRLEDLQFEQNLTDPSSIQQVTDNNPLRAVETNLSQRFRVNQSSLHCRQEVSDSYLLAYVDFEILECPPSYASSTFQLSASTNHTRVMGHVSGRRAVRNECGKYHASVAVMEHNSRTNVTVRIELFWTSNHAIYSNHVSDINNAKRIKGDALKGDNITSLLGPDRMAYLTKHLDRIPGFPISFRILDANNEQATHSPTIPKQAALPPDCATVPLSSWVPAGVGSLGDEPDAPPNHPWPFQVARCALTSYTLDRLTNQLEGYRIRFLGDSNGHFMIKYWRQLMCPELDAGAYYQNKYDCAPYRNNTFQVVYRFFRGAYSIEDDNFVKDMDHLSAALRRNDASICESILGIGMYNVTIVTIPTWLFVYETKEGMNDFIGSIRSMMELCAEQHPDEFAQHIILMQTTSAVGVVSDALSPAESWRGIHNHNIEAVSMSIRQELESYVDGIIPVFDVSYARMREVKTGQDPAHMPDPSYGDVVQLQAAAILSAIQARKKRNGDNGAAPPAYGHPRWFVGLDID